MRRSRTAYVRIPLSVPPLPSDGLRRAALWERAGIIKECVGENVSTHHTDRGAAAASCFRVAETMVTGGAAVARLPLPVSVAGDEFSKRHHTGTSRSTALQHEDAATIVNDGSTDAAEKPPTTSATDTAATTAEEIATDGSKPAGDVQAIESTNAADEPATSTADTPTSEASAAEKKKAKKEKRKQIQKQRREERARSMSRGEERLHRLGQCADTVKYLGPDGVALFESQRGAAKWGRAAFILVSAPKHHTHEFHEAVSESLRERNAVAERAYAAAVADFNRTHGTHGQGGRVADQATRDNGKSGKKKHQKGKSAREGKQLSAAASAIEAALQMDAVTPPAATSVDTATTASNAETETETTPAASTSDSVTDTVETTSEELSVDQSTHADAVKAQEVGGDAASVPTEPFVFPELRLLNVKSYTKAYIAFFAKASAPIDSRRKISSFFSTAERLSAAGLIDVSGRNAGGCTSSWLKAPRQKNSESVGDTHATSPVTDGDGETADVAASAEKKNERRATFEMLFTRKMKRELANAAAAAEKKFKQSKKADTVRGKAKGKGDRMRGMNVATKSHVASVFTGLPVPAFGHTNAQRKARALAESQRRAALNKDSQRRGAKDTKTTGKHTQKSTGKSSDDNDSEKKVGSTKTTADVGSKEYPVDPGLLGPSKYDCLVAWAESLGPLMAVQAQVHQYRSPEHMAMCGLDGNSEGTSDVPGPTLSETFDTPRWKQFDRHDRAHEATTDLNAVSTAATEFDELLDAAADAANCDVALMWRGVAPNTPATSNVSEDPHVNVDNTKGESEEDERKADGVTNVRHHNVTVFLVPRGAKGAKDGGKHSGPRTFQIKSNGAEGDATTASDAPGPGTDSSSASSPLPPTSTPSARDSVAPKARVQAFLAGLTTVKPSASVVQLQHPSHRSVYRASLIFSGPSASKTDPTASSTTTEVDEGEHAPVSGGENPDGEKPQQEVVDLEMKIVVLQSKKSGAVPQGLGAAALLQASPSALHTAALTAAAQRSKLRFQTCGLVDAAGDVVATPTVEDAMAVLGLKAGLDIKM